MGLETFARFIAQRSKTKLEPTFGAVTIKTLML
jgi:hypothetical protein